MPVSNYRFIYARNFSTMAVLSSINEVSSESIVQLTSNSSRGVYYGFSLKNCTY